MNIATYAIEAKVEQTHWWFVGRRKLFASEIERLGLPQDAPILDVGTSTGTNLRMLTEQGYHNVCGLDFSEESIRWCARKGLPPVHKGDVRRLPFGDNSFDLVLATDIIEHVDDDTLAVRELRRVLKPSGHALITVPAFASLWGLQDVVAHHKRRYRMKPLLDKLGKAGLLPDRSYYFNFILFVPIWLARRVVQLFGIKLDSESQINSPLLNRILSGVFKIDISLAPHVRAPFGVSVLVVARRSSLVDSSDINLRITT
jgi:SAM-dependent methyltransferase